MPVRTTHTYAVLGVSVATWREISRKLQDAGYDHAFIADDSGKLLDMHGIALQAEPAPEPPADDPTRCSICGWSYKPTVGEGCVPGNCSMRPWPDTCYSPARAFKEYTPATLVSKYPEQFKWVPLGPAVKAKVLVPRPPTDPRVFYPCGCSRLKVAAGLCDIYDEHGQERSK